MSSTPQPPRYAVQLLLPEPVVLDSAVVHAQMLGWRDDVQLIPSASSHFGFAIESSRTGLAFVGPRELLRHANRSHGEGIACETDPVWTADG